MASESQGLCGSPWVTVPPSGSEPRLLRSRLTRPGGEAASVRSRLPQGLGSQRCQTLIRSPWSSHCWHNGTGSVSAGSGRRFSPQPGRVGKGSGVGCSCGSGLIPGLGNACTTGQPKTQGPAAGTHAGRACGSRLGPHTPHEGARGRSVGKAGARELQSTCIPACTQCQPVSSDGRNALRVTGVTGVTAASSGEDQPPHWLNLTRRHSRQGPDER